MPHEITSLAKRSHYCLSGGFEAACIISAIDSFKVKVEELGFVDITETQMRYAIRLATYEGELLQEERHKLASLCEEVEALRSLGFSVSADLENEFCAIYKP